MYYEGIGPERGKRVSGEDAPAYAMVRCGIGRMQDTPGNAGVPDSPCGLVFLGQLDPEGGRSA